MASNSLSTNNGFSNEMSSIHEKFSEKNDEKLLITKKRKRTNRVLLTEALLCSEDGLVKIYETFPKACKFRGRGYESADLKNMMSLYKEWAFFLRPGVAFPDILNSCERFGHMKKTKDELLRLRHIEKVRYSEWLLNAEAIPQKKVRFADDNSVV